MKRVDWLIDKAGSLYLITLFRYNAFQGKTEKGVEADIMAQHRNMLLIC